MCGVCVVCVCVAQAATRADDEIKNKLAEFNDLKQNVTAIERKEG